MLLHSSVHWGSTEETYGIGRDEEGPSCLPTDKNSCQEVTQTALVSPKLLGCDPGSVSGGVKQMGTSPAAGAGGSSSETRTSANPQLEIYL